MRKSEPLPQNPRPQGTGIGATQEVAETEGTEEGYHAQTRLKELIARCGNVVYVLADSSKLDQGRVQVSDVDCNLSLARNGLIGVPGEFK